MLGFLSPLKTSLVVCGTHGPHLACSASFRLLLALRWTQWCFVLTALCSLRKDLKHYKGPRHCNEFTKPSKKSSVSFGIVRPDENWSKERALEQALGRLSRTGAQQSISPGLKSIRATQVFSISHSFDLSIEEKSKKNVHFFFFKLSASAAGVCAGGVLAQYGAENLLWASFFSSLSHMD